MFQRVLQMDAEEILHLFFSVLHHHATLGNYNTPLILPCFDQLNYTVSAANQTEMSCHLGQCIIPTISSAWFHEHPQFYMSLSSTILILTIFLNPVEEFGHVHACDQIDVVSIQGWIQLYIRIFPCLAQNSIACDVNLGGQMQQGREMFIFYCRK